MPLYVFSRHGESSLNVEGRVNGDPAVPVALTEAGRAAAARLGEQIAHIPIELAVHTRFPRTRETAEIALAGRNVPFETEPLLDDIDVGELEGGTLEAYREWKRRHTRSDRFPGGESLDEAAARYAAAFRRLAERAETQVLVVCHEIPIRYALNAAAGSDDLDGPAHLVQNAVPYLLDERSLTRAEQHIGRILRA
jgi:broad specificity phosphatase PhoE